MNNTFIRHVCKKTAKSATRNEDQCLNTGIYRLQLIAKLEGQMKEAELDQAYVDECNLRSQQVHFNELVMKIGKRAGASSSELNKLGFGKKVGFGKKLGF